MTQHLITTTMRPGEPVSVSDEELVDLERMGVVASHVPSDLSQVPAPTPLVGKAQKPGGTTDGNGQAEESEADGGQAPPATGK